MSWWFKVNLQELHLEKFSGTLEIARDGLFIKKNTSYKLRA